MGTEVPPIPQVIPVQNGNSYIAPCVSPVCMCLHTYRNPIPKQLPGILLASFSVEIYLHMTVYGFIS